MHSAYDDVVSALRQAGREVPPDEARKIAKAVVDAAATVPLQEPDGLHDRRTLAVEATDQYLRRSDTERGGLR